MHGIPSDSPRASDGALYIADQRAQGAIDAAQALQARPMPHDGSVLLHSLYRDYADVFLDTIDNAIIGNPDLAEAARQLQLEADQAKVHRATGALDFLFRSQQLPLPVLAKQLQFLREQLRKTRAPEIIAQFFDPQRTVVINSQEVADGHGYNLGYALSEARAAEVANLHLDKEAMDEMDSLQRMAGLITRNNWPVFADHFFTILARVPQSQQFHEIERLEEFITEIPRPATRRAATEAFENSRYENGFAEEDEEMAEGEEHQPLLPSPPRLGDFIEHAVALRLSRSPEPEPDRFSGSSGPPSPITPPVLAAPGTPSLLAGSEERSLPRSESAASSETDNRELGLGSFH